MKGVCVTLLEVWLNLILLSITVLTTVLWCRALLEFGRANFYNPICQWILKLTSWIVRPFSWCIRIKHIKQYRIDAAILLVLFLLFVLKLNVQLWLMGDSLIHLGWGMLWVCCALLQSLLTVYFYTILFSAVLSWFPSRHTPLHHVLLIISAPVLQPIQQWLKRKHWTAGYVDLSPLVIIVGFQLIDSLILLPTMKSLMIMILQ